MAYSKSGKIIKETNNQPQGRAGSKVKEIPGPARGKTSGNPTKGGGINRATKGKMA